MLKDRAAQLAKARSFFSDKQILEVDCPSLSAFSSIDTHIDVMKAEGRFLHTSPEYGMKRLLAKGSGDIYQLSHVFRHGEIGSLHNPEFTMAEWYRLNFSWKSFIEETVEFIRLFLGEIPSRHISYREAFQRYVGKDYLAMDIEELALYAKTHNIAPSQGPLLNKDSYLQLLMSFIVEPNLGKEELCVLSHYPASQAALAQTKEIHGEKIAERFEIYFKGIELANGYHELASPVEQRERLHTENAQRKALGKEELPLDERFLKALEAGLPDCYGVAVGFDRLMMLRHQKTHIAEVLPFAWEEA